MSSPDTAHALTRENLVAALPPALQKDPSAVALAESMADQLARRPAEIDRLRIYPQTDRLDEPVLDTLAYDFKVDWWDGDYSLDEKRRTMQGNWKVHKLLGTRAAVETGLRAIYPQSWAEPWFAYEDGKPYHFRLHIDLSNEMLAEGKPASVLERVRYYQSLRDHLDEIRYTIEAKQPAVLGLGTGMGANAALGVTEGRDVFDFRSALYPAEAMGAQEIMGVREQPDVFWFSDEVRAGAAENGTRTLLTVPEDTKAPHRVSILRTGGSFVMTALPIFPTEEG